MKQLELNLQKRLLIVEFPIDKFETKFINNAENIEYWILLRFKLKVKRICKGSEFNEEIAKGLVHQSIHTNLFAHYVKDIPVNTYCYKQALDAFISAIEANGYYWGENPEGEEPMIDDFTYIFHQNNGAETINWDHYDFATKQWQESESKTFNPEKCIIFEIL